MMKAMPMGSIDEATEQVAIALLPGWRIKMISIDEGLHKVPFAQRVGGTRIH
jgi:hypothetical protein